MMSQTIKDAFHRNFISLVGGLFAKKGFDELKHKMDYKSFGGAILLGVNGVVIKAHGNSNTYAFKKALELAYNMANTNVVEKIKEGFKDGTN